MISFKLPIRVIPKKRPRVTKFGTYMPKEYTAQKKYIAAKIRGFTPIEGNVSLEVLFGYKKAKSASKNKYSMPLRDIDSLAGTIMDACEGICYNNDRQITELKAKKMYADHDFVYVIFKEIE